MSAIWRGTVEGIHIAAETTRLPASVAAIRAVRGKGLEEILRRFLRSLGLVWSIAACSCGDGGLIVRTVSEYQGSPIVGVKVQVDDQAWQTTDAAGEARFAKVAGPYTVRIHQVMSFKDTKGIQDEFHKVFVLVGRTANPLVTEVDGSLASSFEGHSSRFSGTVTGRSGTPSQVTIAVQGLASGGVVAADGSFDQGLWWEAGTTVEREVRALESTGEQPQIHFIGYGSTRARFTDNTGYPGSGNLSGVNVQLHPVSEARVSGQVTRPDALAQGDLAANLQLRFGTYDWMGAGSGKVSGQSAAFDYAMPVVEGGPAWIEFSGPFAVGSGFDQSHGWHDRKVALPSAGVGFALPPPPVLIDPAEGATIGPATVYRWTAAEPNGTYTLDVGCGPWFEANGTIQKTINYRGIETTGTELSLPSFAGVVVPPGTPCFWFVWWNAPTDPAVESRGSSSGFRNATMQ